MVKQEHLPHPSFSSFRVAQEKIFEIQTKGWENLKVWVSHGKFQPFIFKNSCKGCRTTKKLKIFIWEINKKFLSPSPTDISCSLESGLCQSNWHYVMIWQCIQIIDPNSLIFQRYRSHLKGDYSAKSPRNIWKWKQKKYQPNFISYGLHWQLTNSLKLVHTVAIIVYISLIWLILFPT